MIVNDRQVVCISPPFRGGDIKYSRIDLDLTASRIGIVLTKSIWMIFGAISLLLVSSI